MFSVVLVSRGPQNRAGLFVAFAVVVVVSRRPRNGAGLFACLALQVNVRSYSERSTVDSGGC